MAEKSTGADRLAEIIRDQYDLGDVQTPQRLEKAHQRRHQKLVVTTSKGRFLVKTYKREPLILDSLRFQHRLAAHLIRHQFPVAAICEAKNGKRIVEEDDWALELQVYIEGEPMKVNGPTLAASGSALGRFHEICRDIPHPERDTRMWRFSEVPRQTFAKLYERAKEEGDPARVDAHCNTIALFLQNAAKQLSSEAREEFETGLIHGDWHSGNMIFVGDRLAGVVDLEFAGAGCYLEDLAYAVSNLCIRTTTEHERLMKRTDLLLERYQLHRTLTPAEQRALYYAVGIKHVVTVSYQFMLEDLTVAGHTPNEWMEILDRQCQWLGLRAQNSQWAS